MTAQKKTFSRQQIVILSIIFILAFGIRLFNLQQAPLDYQPSHQYNFLLNARKNFENVQISNHTTNKKYESKLLENVASYSFKHFGENFWFVRFLNICFWMIAAYFLALTSLKLYGPMGSLISTSVFLLLPLGIQASRCLLPVSLSVLFLSISLWVFVRYLKHFNFKILFCISILPFLSYCLMIGTWPNFGSLDLWLSAIYWKNLYFLMQLVFSIPLLIMAVIGHQLNTDKKNKDLISAATLGFVITGIVFSGESHTDTNFHLTFLPFICLAIVPLGLALHSVMLDSRISKLALCLITSLCILFCLREGRLLLKKVPANIQKTALLRKALPISTEIKTLEEMGKHANHSQKCIILSHSDALPLKFHGRLEGVTWKEDLKLPFNSYFNNGAEYFVISDLYQFNKKTKLKLKLEAEATLIKKTKRYFVYKLKP